MSDKHKEVSDENQSMDEVVEQLENESDGGNEDFTMTKPAAVAQCKNAGCDVQLWFAVVDGAHIDFSCPGCCVKTSHLEVFENLSDAIGHVALDDYMSAMEDE